MENAALRSDLDEHWSPATCRGEDGGALAALSCSIRSPRESSWPKCGQLRHTHTHTHFAEIDPSLDATGPKPPDQTRPMSVQCWATSGESGPKLAEPGRCRFTIGPTSGQLGRVRADFSRIRPIPSQSWWPLWPNSADHIRAGLGSTKFSPGLTKPGLVQAKLDRFRPILCRARIERRFERARKARIWKMLRLFDAPSFRL